MIPSAFRSRFFRVGVLFALVAAFGFLAQAPGYDDLTSVEGRVTGTWERWRQHGWVLATDRGPERVRVGQFAWGSETELLSAGILEGDRIRARLGRDIRRRPNGDMWEMVVNGDTVLTYAGRQRRTDRMVDRMRLAAAAAAVLLMGAASLGRHRRSEEQSAIPGQTD